MLKLRVTISLIIFLQHHVLEIVMLNITQLEKW